MGHAFSGHIQSGTFDESFRFRLVAEQRFDLPAQHRVVEAGLIQEGRALIFLPLQSSVVDPLDFFPAIRLHRNKLGTGTCVPIFYTTHLSHTARTELIGDFVAAESGSCREGHRLRVASQAFRRRVQVNLA